MNQTQTFSDFLTTQTPHIEIAEFSINLALTTLLVFILAAVYTRYGNVLSNRRAFSQNLVLVGMTTMLIITIVKSSLALSLGLVGALSIVRFRTPIKEPEELAYLFLSIATGLGLGAGQRTVVVVGFVFIIAVIWLFHLRRTSFDEQGMHLTVAMDAPPPDLLDRVIKILEQHAASVQLRRVDETADSFQGDFSVMFDEYETMNEAKLQLHAIDKNMQVSFLDNRVS